MENWMQEYSTHIGYITKGMLAIKTLKSIPKWLEMTEYILPRLFKKKIDLSLSLYYSELVWMSLKSVWSFLVVCNPLITSQHPHIYFTWAGTNIAIKTSSNEKLDQLNVQWQWWEMLINQWPYDRINNNTVSSIRNVRFVIVYRNQIARTHTKLFVAIGLFFHQIFGINKPLHE